jgi:glycerate kinase
LTESGADIRVVACPDKFRGSATAVEICQAIILAVTRIGGRAQALAMSDGGEGLLEAYGGGNRTTAVRDSLGRQIDAPWRLSGDGLAVIETAMVCGLSLAGGALGNDVRRASTFGVGQLIRRAVSEGAKHILVGIGGTATTDGGAGAIRALESLLPLTGVNLDVCCDVSTDFVSAATVFGPQKGATPRDVAFLAKRLRRLWNYYLVRFGCDVSCIPGAGAGGGLAGGLAAIGATLTSGFERVATDLGLDGALAASDLAVTGEGRFDQTSLSGKVVGGVCRRAATAGVPVLAVVGQQDGTTACQGLEVIALADEVGLERALREPLTALVEVLVPRLLARTQRSP